GPEGPQVVPPHGEPGSHVVATEAFEQVAALGQSRVKIEAGDASPGSLSDVAVEGDQEGGPAVALDHARRHDSDHAGVPAFAVEHNDRIESASLAQLVQHLIEDPLIDELA